MLTPGGTLSNHLHDDLFSHYDSGDTLYILDDYNIDQKLSDNDLHGYVDAIAAVRQIRRVKIFLQNKGRKPDRAYLFNVAPGTTEQTLQDNYDKKRRFIELFEEECVYCCYIVYPSRLIGRPPFHGRYWLSNTDGFIVDGSINTSIDKLVLAQTMDAENYGIIRGKIQPLFDENAYRYNNVQVFDAVRLRDAFYDEMNYLQSRHQHNG